MAMTLEIYSKPAVAAEVHKTGNMQMDLTSGDLFKVESNGVEWLNYPVTKNTKIKVVVDIIE